MTNGQLVEELMKTLKSLDKKEKKVAHLMRRLRGYEEVIEPLKKSRKATMIASEHGTEAGDDKQFDEVYWTLYKAQKAMEKNAI